MFKVSDVLATRVSPRFTSPDASLRIRLPRFLLLLAALSIVTTLGFGQGIIRGSIGGVVQDPSGAVISGATVTAKSLETNQTFTTTTNDSGIFSMASVPVGHYTVTVVAPNFAKTSLSNIEVTVGKQTTLNDIHMQVGSSSETVEVTGAAPLVETASTQISNTLESKDVTSLPVGAGIDQLALFMPGINSTGSVSRSNSNGAQISANGQRQRSNNFQIDGQSINDTSVAGPAIFLENKDLIAEYQVLTHYDAQYGRNLGSQVNVITKSGGNQFHGTAFETWRGSTFDSLKQEEKSSIFGFCKPGQDPTATGCSPIKDPSRVVENFFGGTIGGPILKDKAWFFGSALWDRFRGSPSPSTDPLGLGRVVPTPAGVAALAAAFPNSPAVGFLKTFGPTAVGPTATFSSLITKNVTANGVTTAVQFGTPKRIFNAPSNIRQISGRGDVQLSSKDRVFARYIVDDEANPNVDEGDGAAGFAVDVPSKGQQIGADWSRQWSNTSVNQVRFNWSKLTVAFEGGNTGCVNATINNCPTNIAFQDGTLLPMGVATNLPQGRENDYWEIQDNFSKLKGRHQLKWGGDFSHQSSPSTFLPNTNGAYVFPDFNSFIANTPFRLSIVSGSPTLSYKEKDLGFYFQDDWHMTNTLTVQLGMRWEWFQQGINLLHDLTVAQQGGSNPFWNTSLPLSRTTIVKIPEDYNNFGPIVGFAWQAREKTVVRGGFRIAYDTTFYNIASNTATNAPTVNAAQLTTTNPGQIVPGLPTSAFTGNDVRAIALPLIPSGNVTPCGPASQPICDPGFRAQTLVDPHFHTPYSQQWTFGIEREINNNLAFETRYVGNHGVGLYQNIDGNPALNALITNGFGGLIPAGLTPCTTPGAPGAVAGAAGGFADCNRQNVNLRTNTGFNTYHGLQNELKVRSYHGLAGTLSYTWSHNIDNASEVFSTTGAGLLSAPQNPFDFGHGERANSSYDYRHTLGLAMVYDLPFFKGQSGIVAKILGGWQPDVTYRYSTGQPYNLIQTKSSSLGTSGSSSLCDPSGYFSTSTDICRPILGNPTAPFGNVGVYKLVAGVPTLFDLVSGATTTPTNEHWIANNAVAAKVYGTPFAGMARNSLNGQPVHAMNFAMTKSTKINERMTFQLRATAYNVLNHGFYGVPSNSLTSALNTPNALGTLLFKTGGGGSAASIENGLSRRRLEFGGKLVF